MSHVPMLMNTCTQICSNESKFGIDNGILNQRPSLYQPVLADHAQYTIGNYLSSQSYCNNKNSTYCFIAVSVDKSIG